MLIEFIAFKTKQVVLGRPDFLAEFIVDKLLIKIILTPNFEFAIQVEA